MSENRAAYEANSSAGYDRRRFEASGGVECDPLPGMAFRMGMTLRCLEWCWSSQPDQPRAVLDVAAGLGNVGQHLRKSGNESVYHATEQSAKQCAEIQQRVPTASVCEWRCEVVPPLLEALGKAAAPFLREYPAVLLSHGPEHHADAYAIMDECWSLVREGGFLLVIAARNDPHRSHFRRYDYLDLLALCAHYAGFGNPLVVWELDSWSDYYVAIPKQAVAA